ncbi:MAG: hypothetical protein D6786_00675 [Gammaproteobacteria bacterium]|nr:MAG: hypothetical protein D6786_00675 [Gammaproteobacteria bacterium]
MPKGIHGAIICALLMLGASSGAGAITTITPFSGSVASSVTPTGGGTWTYDYTVTFDLGELINDGDAIVSFDIPYFSDALITGITSPAGWAHSVEDIGFSDPANGWTGVALWQDPLDPNYQGPTSPYTTGDQVLHWYATGPGGGIPPGGSLGGFGYVAAYPGTKAPHQLAFTSILGDVTLTGDPLIPASPSVTAVPLPASLGVMILSLAGFLLTGAARRRMP